jgi:hypothetical protein
MISLTDPAFFVALTGTVAVAFLATRMLFGHDSREPPLAPQSIPFIGHIIGLSKSNFNYYVGISKKINAPIFTLPIPGQKMYVITKPDLVQTVQKLHKTLAFPPIVVKFSVAMCGPSPESQSKITHNINGDEGDLGLVTESHDAVDAGLRPGPNLDDMNRVMLAEIAKSLNQLQPPRGGTRRISMYSWLRDAITKATTRSVYGPMNPYEDKSVADAFWDFESGVMSIVIGILPSITARKPIAAREKVAKAIAAYYEAGGVEKASVLTQNRYNVGVKHGLPIIDIARFEVGGSMAVLVNTAPAAFWTLLLVQMHKDLLDEIRQEVDACIEKKDEHLVLDIAALKERCPLLLSCYQEVLRYRAMGTSVREVMEDTYLDQWLLKKGAMIQIPSRVLHEDASLWGDSVADFNPRRFLASERQNRPKDVCFRAFGGGKTLCPGRHFATNEILAVVAVFVSRFNMEPVTGSWQLPTALNTNAAAVVMEPDHDIDVEISVREGFEDVQWAVKLDGTDKLFALVTEDNVEAEA